MFWAKWLDADRLEFADRGREVMSMFWLLVRMSLIFWKLRDGWLEVSSDERSANTVKALILSSTSFLS